MYFKGNTDEKYFNFCNNKNFLKSIILKYNDNEKNLYDLLTYNNHISYLYNSFENIKHDKNFFNFLNYQEFFDFNNEIKDIKKQINDIKGKRNPQNNIEKLNPTVKELEEQELNLRANKVQELFKHLSTCKLNLIDLGSFCNSPIYVNYDIYMLRINKNYFIKIEIPDKESIFYYSSEQEVSDYVKPSIEDFIPDKYFQNYISKETDNDKIMKNLIHYLLPSLGRIMFY